MQKLKKEREKMKKLYPNIYLKKVEDITIETLIKNKIKLLILDVDNTLIDYYKNLSENIIKWTKEMKGQGIKLYILSNTNNEQKVEKAVVGDQIFTDVLGGNRSKMFTILVDPIDAQKDYWYTAWKRPIENKIKNKYKAKEEKNKDVY